MKKMIPILFIVAILMTGMAVFILKGGNEENGEGKLPDLKKEKQVNQKLALEETKVLEENLAKLRKENKRDRAEGIALSVKDGNDSIPAFSEEEIGKVLEVSKRYLEDKYGRDYEKDWYMGANIDPRMSEIYRDEDKGVCKGYQADNIYIIEFEKEKEKYEYLFLIREDYHSDWRVIHEGSDYKKR